MRAIVGKRIKLAEPYRQREGKRRWVMPLRRVYSGYLLPQHFALRDDVPDPQRSTSAAPHSQVGRTEFAAHVTGKMKYA